MYRWNRSQFALLLVLPAISFGSTSRMQPDSGRVPVRIHGTVTNFAGEPLAGAEVHLKRDDFSDASRAVTDSQGRYSMLVPAGRYLALAAVRDYQVKNLEYWAWNVPADADVEINPRVDRIEVYALNAWRPQGAYPSYQVYCRPMSLTKVTAAFVAAGGMEGLGKLPVLDIAPELDNGNVEATVDGERVEVLVVSRVKEASGPNQCMCGYVIQLAMPKSKPAGKHAVIDIVLTDPKTGEKGEGCLFVTTQF